MEARDERGASKPRIPLNSHINKKKTSEEVMGSFLVALVRSHWNDISSEILRWRQVIGVTQGVISPGVS